MFLIDVTAAEALPDRKLALRFADGRSGVVAVDPLIGEYTGVFEPLLDPEFFVRVEVNSELGTVAWPNGADLCPDVLYAHATGQLARLQAAVDIEREGQSPSAPGKTAVT